LWCRGWRWCCQDQLSGIAEKIAELAFGYGFHASFQCVYGWNASELLIKLSNLGVGCLLDFVEDCFTRFDFRCQGCIHLLVFFILEVCETGKLILSISAGYSPLPQLDGGID